MTRFAVVGGVYRESCEWPIWDEIYGSAGRAAIAVSGIVSDVHLHCCLDELTLKQFRPMAESFGIHLAAVDRPVQIAFHYRHVLSRPSLAPAREQIKKVPVFEVEADVALVFGMLEADPRVHARICVYDPQNPIAPRGFRESGGKADRLAIVGNRAEIRRMAGLEDENAAAEAIYRSENAEIVVVKCGLDGAKIFSAQGMATVPAYVSEGGWTLGSGDVFAACFAALWGYQGLAPEDAANRASWAVSKYMATRGLPATLPMPVDFGAATKVGKPPTIYLAGPFFTMDQRWLIDEARRYLSEMGAKVFSPFHEIGEGPAELVVAADLKALDESDVVFALIDGCDPGTIFELGYAVAKGKKNYAYATRVSEGDLKMLTGSGVKVIEDFATAIFQSVSLA